MQTAKARASLRPDATLGITAIERGGLIGVFTYASRGAPAPQRPGAEAVLQYANGVNGVNGSRKIRSHCSCHSFKGLS